MAQTKRKSTGKRLRFEVFKRDRFTCQYCGAQPPDIVLVCDHIDPVALGGATTIDNLITSCETCNQGKAAKPLTDRHVRPDADLMFLEVQQELAELRRYREAEKERDAEIEAIAEDMQKRWCDITGDEYAPEVKIFHQLLRQYSPQVVHKTVLVVAKKEADGFFVGNWEGLTPYIWGVAKRVSAQTEEGGDHD